MLSTWIVVLAGASIGVIANTKLVARLGGTIPLGGPRGAVVLLLLIPALVVATALLLGGALAALEVEREATGARGDGAFLPDGLSERSTQRRVTAAALEVEREATGARGDGALRPE